MVVPVRSAREQPKLTVRGQAQDSKTSIQSYAVSRLQLYTEELPTMLVQYVPEPKIIWH